MKILSPVTANQRTKIIATYCDFANSHVVVFVQPMDGMGQSVAVAKANGQFLEPHLVLDDDEPYDEELAAKAAKYEADKPMEVSNRGKRFFKMKKAAPNKPVRK